MNLEEAQAWAEKLAAFLGVAWAWSLLEERWPFEGCAFHSDRLRDSRLLNRMNRGRQRQCLEELAGLGAPLAVLKGYHLADLLYDEPEQREPGDLDLLVRAQDLSDILKYLKEKGFRFGSEDPKPWGFISEASYVPFVSPDNQLHLDLHIQPDCYPFYLGLETGHFLAGAQPREGGPENVLVPDVTIAFLLLASNAAKDKFGPFAIKKFADALMLLRQPALVKQIDWPRMAALANQAKLLRPLGVFLALLEDLGAMVPGAAPTQSAQRRRPLYQQTLEDLGALNQSPRGLLPTLRREFTLTAEPSVALRNNLMRAKGLLSPRSGLPPGWPKRQLEIWTKGG